MTLSIYARDVRVGDEIVYSSRNGSAVWRVLSIKEGLATRKFACRNRDGVENEFGHRTRKILRINRLDNK